MLGGKERDGIVGVDIEGMVAQAQVRCPLVLACRKFEIKNKPLDEPE